MQETRTKRRRRYAGVSLEQRRTRRRHQLLEAGEAVFGDKGFHAATVRDICAQAGLTERYFYESFENREALFGAVYHQLLERLRQDIFQVLDQSPREMESLARAALGAYFGTMRREPRMARILLIEVYGTTQDLDRLYRRAVHDFAELMRGIMESLYPLPAESVLDAGLLSSALVGAAIHLALRWTLGGYRESQETMVENCMAIFRALARELELADQV